MKKSRFTEEQIAYALKQAELGTALGETSWKMGIAEGTFYVWRKKYGGLGSLADVCSLLIDAGIGYCDLALHLPQSSGRDSTAGTSSQRSES